MKSGRILAALVAAVLGGTCAVPFAADRLPSGPTFKEVPIATVRDAGKPFTLRANIYLPRGNAGTPTPLVLFIHGHGGAYNFSNGARSYEFSIALAERGIAVATIDYRPDDPLPGEIHDVKGYVRWFRARAKDYNIDPSRIGIWGTSRGGHLAALLATSGDVKELEGDVGGNPEQSSRIQCAVIFYPLTDLLSAGQELLRRFPGRVRTEDDLGLVTRLVGYTGERGMTAVRELAAKGDRTDPAWRSVELAKLANAIDYVTADDPPIFLAHSANDQIVAVDQSIRLYDRYVANGLDANLMLWAKGSHGNVGPDIEAAASEWIVRKLLVELAPKK